MHRTSLAQAPVRKLMKAMRRAMNAKMDAQDVRESTATHQETAVGR